MSLRLYLSLTQNTEASPVLICFNYGLEPLTNELC